MYAWRGGRKSLLKIRQRAKFFKHRWTRSKILEGGVVSFPEGEGCKFFESEGGYPPPDPPKIFACGSHYFYITFFIKFHALNGIVSPPQAKIFINSEIKGQNQAIGMILHITI